MRDAPLDAHTCKQNQLLPTVHTSEPVVQRAVVGPCAGRSTPLKSRRLSFSLGARSGPGCASANGRQPNRLRPVPRGRSVDEHLRIATRVSYVFRRDIPAALMWPRNVATSTGFSTTMSAQPLASMFLAADQRITNAFFKRSSSRMARQTATPSIAGIMKSQIMMSGRCSLASARPAGPSNAEKGEKPSASSIIDQTAQMSRSSSMSKMVEESIVCKYCGCPNEPAMQRLSQRAYRPLRTSRD
ncbi:hypothetical protein AWB76_07497 [Caballeronia temeraria]|uniref:Uncharacterized protein n=1 Tax=Caballeronia temeraria TaxID=1777137 RepID=A0A158DU68_9BURK|nr:hypothetical protein AWB76_07497 [Caballeronia temeraria]